MAMTSVRETKPTSVDTLALPQMQAHVVGQGPPLVLVGGGLTGWKSWEPHAERLAEGRTVARLQPMNVQYGLDNRRLPEGYSVKMESAALAAALDELGWVEPLDLVAWSYGGVISLDFALNHPERIRSLTLIEPAAPWVLPEKGADDPEIQTEKTLEASFGLSTSGDDLTEDDFKRFLLAAGLAPPDTDPTTLPQWPVWYEHRRSLRGVSTFGHDDDPERLKDFDRPVLLVLGTGTVTFQRRIHEALISWLPRARAVEMPSGHAPQIVSMDRFLIELARFHECAVESIEHVTSGDGTEIGFSRRGSGPPILFVHGTTADRRSWSAMATHLVDHFTVYAMDRRGRGASGDADEYAFEREIEDVVAVIDAIGEPVAVFGHSFGGLVSLEAALRTDNLSRLILYEPVLPTDQVALPPGVGERIRERVERGDLDMAMEVFLREVAGMTDAELLAYRNGPLWNSRLPLIATVPRELTIESTNTFDSGRFFQLDVPVMLLTGENSSELYRAGVAHLDAALPNASLVVLPGQQHVAHLMNPELVVEKVGPFVAD